MILEGTDSVLQSRKEISRSQERDVGIFVGILG
jgi:hypothetical protein